MSFNSNKPSYRTMCDAQLDIQNVLDRTMILALDLNYFN